MSRCILSGYELDVRQCHKKLAPWIVRTPLVESYELSTIAGVKVYLKLESFQKTGAFKFRGAMNYLLGLSPEQRARGVITASSGNHGLGMSLGSKLLGINCTVVMPRRAPAVKRKKAESYGARVIISGENYDESAAFASELANSEGLAYVPSFNHPAIIEGQGTIMLEIESELGKGYSVITPIGGGGLLAGLLVAKNELGLDVEVLGAEPEGAASMKAALHAGRPVTLETLGTIADGVAVKTVGDLTFSVVNSVRPEVLVVSDESILEAQRMLLLEAKVISEAAGAVSVAALLNMPPNERPEKVVCIITGANLDEEALRGFIR